MPKKPKTIQPPPIFTDPETPVNCPIRRCTVPEQSASRRILIMRAGAFGDILMGTVILAALRQADPNVHLTWIAEHSEVQAIDANPLVDRIVRWNSGYFTRPMRKYSYLVWASRTVSLIRELRKHKYDIFISLQPEEWPFVMKGSGAPVTIGVFDTFKRFYRAKRSSPYWRLYRHAFRYTTNPDHRIDQYLQAVSALGYEVDSGVSLTMGYTEDDRTVADQFLSANGLGPVSDYYVVAPSTTWPSKCWKSQNYVALCDIITKRYGLPVVLIGSAKERDEVQAIANQLEPVERIASARPDFDPPHETVPKLTAKSSPLPGWDGWGMGSKSQAIVAAGDLTFRQTAALIDRARLLVSGDTGPMHVASALGTPHVAIFGATGAHWYGSRSPVGRLVWESVPCGPCDQKVCPNSGDDHMLCMEKITVDAVLAAVDEVLERSSDGVNLQNEGV